MPWMGVSPRPLPWRWDALIPYPLCRGDHPVHVYFGSRDGWSKDTERRIQVSRRPQEYFTWGEISLAPGAARMAESQGKGMVLPAGQGIEDTASREPQSILGTAWWVQPCSLQLPWENWQTTQKKKNWLKGNIPPSVRVILLFFHYKLF